MPPQRIVETLSRSKALASESGVETRPLRAQGLGLFDVKFSALDDDESRHPHSTSNCQASPSRAVASPSSELVCHNPATSSTLPCTNTNYPQYSNT